MFPFGTVFHPCVVVVGVGGTDDLAVRRSFDLDLRFFGFRLRTCTSFLVRSRTHRMVSSAAFCTSCFASFSTIRSTSRSRFSWSARSSSVSSSTLVSPPFFFSVFSFGSSTSLRSTAIVVYAVSSSTCSTATIAHVPMANPIDVGAASNRFRKPHRKHPDHPTTTHRQVDDDGQQTMDERRWTRVDRRETMEERRWARDNGREKIDEREPWVGVALGWGDTCDPWIPRWKLLCGQGDKKALRPYAKQARRIQNGTKGAARSSKVARIRSQILHDTCVSPSRWTLPYAISSLIRDIHRANLFQFRWTR